MSRSRPERQRELPGRPEGTRGHLMKLVTAGVVAVVGLGLGAASASAYSVDGISGNPYNYTGAPASSAWEHSFTVDGAYTIVCPKADTAFSGTATGSAETFFTPYWGANNGTGEVCDFLGFPAKVTQSGTWSFMVTDNVSTTYRGEIRLQAGSTTTLYVPIANCTATISPRTFLHGALGSVVSAVNVAGGVDLTFLLGNLRVASATATCPFSAPTTAVYNSNGPISIPGIRINP